MPALRDGQRLTDWRAKGWTDRRASGLRSRQTGGLTATLKDRYMGWKLTNRWTDKWTDSKN